MANTSGQWREAAPQFAASFSAVAYYFARDLRKALGVPVGVIQATVSGTAITCWVSDEALASAGQKNLTAHVERERTKIRGVLTTIYQSQGQAAPALTNASPAKKTDEEPNAGGRG